MEDHQFTGLIGKIDKLLSKPTTTAVNKKKLQKAKKYLLSSNEFDWEKGFVLLGKVITGANTFSNITKHIWDWILNLF